MRKYGPFVLGMITMALLVSVVQSAAATSEQVRFNTAGIALFGEEKVVAGETYTAPNGQKVPSVITYIDETGGTTNYLSARQISELFDAKISWNAQENRVEIAPPPSLTGDDIEGQKESDGPLQSTLNPTAPVLGTKAGPFTEVDPNTVDMTMPTGTLLDEAKIQSGTGYSTEGLFYPTDGNHVVFKVTNNGTETQAVFVGRPYTVGWGFDKFTTVNLAPGKTLIRAFYISDDAEELQSTLSFSVYSIESAGNTDITVSLQQFD